MELTKSYFTHYQLTFISDTCIWCIWSILCFMPWSCSPSGWGRGGGVRERQVTYKKCGSSFGCFSTSLPSHCLDGCGSYGDWGLLRSCKDVWGGCTWIEVLDHSALGSGMQCGENTAAKTKQWAPCWQWWEGSKKTVQWGSVKIPPPICPIYVPAKYPLLCLKSVVNNPQICVSLCYSGYHRAVAFSFLFAHWTS
jgi:hypothetical protein